MDQKGCNQLDVVHKMVVLKQFSLCHRSDCCDCLTHDRLLGRAETLGREGVTSVSV